MKTFYIAHVSGQPAQNSGQKDTQEAAIEWAKTQMLKTQVTTVFIYQAVAVVERDSPPVVVKNLLQPDVLQTTAHELTGNDELRGFKQPVCAEMPETEQPRRRFFADSAY